jgi:MFS family permease
MASWWTLAVLLMLGLYSIADRPMISLQVEALRKDLMLSDFQVGLVQGVSVAIFAALVGYPLAWLADRFDRRYVLAGSVAVWAGALALSAFSRSFEQLFFFNALVGAGEACLVPISLALVAELFRGSQRHLANSIMMVGGRLGLGLVIALCGWLILAVDTWRHLLPAELQSLETWRLSMLALALPGVALLPLILLLPKPQRSPAAGLGGAMVQAPGVSAGAVGCHSVRRFLREHATIFACFFFGMAMLVMAIGCVKAFAPVVAMREMGASASQAGNGVGTATFVATVVGFLIAQVAYRRLAPRFGPQVSVTFMVAAVIVSGLVVLCLPLVSTPTQLYAVFGLFLAVILAGTLLWPTVLQDLTPAPIRTQIAAITVTLNIVIGSLGPAIVGLVSDQLKERAGGLLLAIAGSAFVALAVSALLLWPVASRYAGAVAAARAEDNKGAQG